MWMKRSMKPVASWHCDVCRQPLRVEFGGGVPIGSRYFWREIDVNSGDDLDAPGLVSVLLISFLQMLVSIIGAAFVRSALWSGDVADWASCPLLSFMMLCFAIWLECARMFCYDCLFALKLHATCIGACWRPAEDLGQFGEDCILPVLSLLAEVVNSVPKSRALMFLVSLVLYMALSQIAGTLFGQSLLVVATRLSLGLQLPAPPTHEDRFPALSTLLPGMLMNVVGVYTNAISTASLSMNLFAIAKLLKRAFVDCQAVPLRVLPIRAAPSPDACGVKDAAEIASEQRSSSGSGARPGAAKRKAKGKNHAS